MSGKFPYEDIVDLPRPISKKHPQASIEDRAARFSPFAAISGYEEMVREAARFTQPRIELDENRKAVLDERMRQSVGQTVRITYFEPDLKKEGGAYRIVTDTVRCIDEHKRRLLLEDGAPIAIDEIFDIEK